MFWVLVVAILVGAGIGLATGGRIANLGRARLHALGLLIVGTVAQAAVLGQVVPVHGSVALVVLLGAYLCLAGFGVANLGRGGMGVILTGIALNAIPIAVNGGMPVEANAIVRARIAKPAELPLLDFGAKRHLAGGNDHLRILDDRFPDWITHHAVSFGDLVIGVGVGAVAYGMVHPATGRRRRKPRRPDSRSRPPPARHGVGDGRGPGGDGEAIGMRTVRASAGTRSAGTRSAGTRSAGTRSAGTVGASAGIVVASAGTVASLAGDGRGDGVGRVRASASPGAARPGRAAPGRPASD
jgi:hypothetical protein